jgi:hypothetical protein
MNSHARSASLTRAQGKLSARFLASTELDNSEPMWCDHTQTPGLPFCVCAYLVLSWLAPIYPCDGHAFSYYRTLTRPPPIDPLDTAHWCSLSIMLKCASLSALSCLPTPALATTVPFWLTHSGQAATATVLFWPQPPQ